MSLTDKIKKNKIKSTLIGVGAVAGLALISINANNYLNTNTAINNLKKHASYEMFCRELNKSENILNDLDKVYQPITVGGRIAINQFQNKYCE